MSETDLEKNPNYLLFLDDPDLADEVISRHLGYRNNEIKELREKVLVEFGSGSLGHLIDIDKIIGGYDPTKFDPTTWKEWGMGIYYLKKLADLLNDNWTSDSSIYDLETWSSNLSNFFERVRTRPDKQFLIPVDFHY